MLYTAWMVILDDHGIKKISFEKFRVKNCMSMLCTNPLENPSPVT